MSKEATARIKINKLLEEAGWRFFDDENGHANILLENYVKVTQTEIDAWGQRDTALSFIWEDGTGVERFRGMGMQIGANRIAVTYWNDGNELPLSF